MSKDIKEGKSNPSGKPAAGNEPPEVKTIEEHAAELKISIPLLCGLKAFKGWARGKRVAKREMLKALNNFCNAPASGGNE